MNEKMIEDRRARTGKRCPVRSSRRKRARIAWNSISRALIGENANEMRESQFESHSWLSMYQETSSADISGRNVSHFQSETRPRSHGIPQSFPSPFAGEVS